MTGADPWMAQSPQPMVKEDTERSPSLSEVAAKAIEIRSVTKVFRSTSGGQTTALQDVNLTVARGSISCIIGPSGCGKTTLLNVVAGFEPPTAGEVLVEGRRIVRPGVDRVVIFQDVAGSLMPWMTARRNVEFGMRLAGKPRHDRRRETMRALEMVHLADAADKYVYELSGGMQQRVQIARALVLRPPVLLMDEPFGALDYLTRSKLHGHLQELHAQSGVTILFVTHDIGEAAVLGDEIHVMGSGGRIVRKIEVPMPRPRTVTSPEVVRVVQELTNLMLNPAAQNLSAKGSNRPASGELQ